MPEHIEQGLAELRMEVQKLSRRHTEVLESNRISAETLKKHGDHENPEKTTENAWESPKRHENTLETGAEKRFRGKFQERLERQADHWSCFLEKYGLQRREEELRKGLEP